MTMIIITYRSWEVSTRSSRLLQDLVADSSRRVRC